MRDTGHLLFMVFWSHPLSLSLSILTFLSLIIFLSFFSKSSRFFCLRQNYLARWINIWNYWFASFRTFFCIGKQLNVFKRVTRYVILSKKITLNERQYTLEWKRGFNLWLCILRNFHFSDWPIGGGIYWQCEAWVERWTCPLVRGDGDWIARVRITWYA